MPIVVALVLLVVGSIVFHFASPWWFTPLAADWGTIDFTINLTFWVTGFVFIAINLFMAYAIFRFRRKPGHKAVYEPENAKLEIGLSTVTAIGVIAMLAPGLFTWAKVVTVPDDAEVVEVIAQQWQWSFRYPGEDGVMGTVDTEHINEFNPFGVNPDDPNGQDDVLVKKPEMHLPVDRPVQALLRSKDVLHNYTVPQFRVKMDMIPGMVSYVWFEPTVAGSYDILCEELCGLAHFAMRASVVVDEAEDYEAWLAEQTTFGEMQSQAEPDLAAGQQQYAMCASCHGQQGEGNQDMNAPRLAGMQPWYMERQLRYFQEGIRGAHEDDQYGQVMAPMASMLNSTEAVRNVAAYVAQLPVEAAPAMIQGDANNGERIYRANCAACHKADASGSWFTDAPELAGTDDWYMATQLRNFRDGVRGAHPQDDYGEQMVSMTAALRSDEDLLDVVSYINTLR